MAHSVPGFARRAIHTFGRAYVERICQSEAQSQTFVRVNERPIEYSFALRALSGGQPRTVLDVGTGTTAWPHLLRNCGYVVTAIDNVRDYWPHGMTNRHWQVQDVNIVKPNGRLAGKEFDAITCISVIEHIEDHVAAVRNMVQLLAPDGILILTTPFSHFNPYPNVYKHPDATWRIDLPYICRSSSATELRQWLDFGLRLDQRELWRMFTGPMWRTGDPCAGTPAGEDEPHQLGLFVLRRA
jgi:2-polyprenyl-3-methyl-5-hydroxy-6-metoxy-1,4-benzoquinol methylase